MTELLTPEVIKALKLLSNVETEVSLVISLIIWKKEWRVHLDRVPFS